jgi:hypothetical protein
VLQQVEIPTGSLQEKTIIDGQQRLTTLQLLMDAVHGELLKVGAKQADDLFKSFREISQIGAAAAGGMLIGILEALVSGYGNSLYAEPIIFGAILVVLLIRPYGLLGDFEAVQR